MKITLKEKMIEWCNKLETRLEENLWLYVRNDPKLQKPIEEEEYEGCTCGQCE